MALYVNYYCPNCEKKQMFKFTAWDSKYRCPTCGYTYDPSEKKKKRK